MTDTTPIVSAPTVSVPDRTGRTGRSGRAKVPHPMAVRRLTVARVAPVTRAIVRVTLAGPELAGFVSTGPSDHVKVFFPDPATGELSAPTLVDGALQRPASGTAYPRDYTPRAFRPIGAGGGPELDLDLVLHADGGPATTWAARAAVGDELVVAGPRSSKLVPAGFDAFVLACDESALPAVGRWLDLLPAATPVLVLAEVSAADDGAYLGLPRAGVEVRWLRREGAAGSSGVLERELRALGPIGPGTFVWVGGEAGTLVGVRRYLRRELGLPADRAEVNGYWRRGSADFDHHAPLDPTDPD
ncbi:siderophore-interacting protein [Pengzhenrongella sicca]|uniref:Siderophore-interacting protein n=1 Tax=Pengzhenrongella sicca TaxID=2819238 RepID=A0A8A4ZGF3_9MICO|nr:siderophore-interacting protein [Pengzhenrongella sicca]QTE31120.1 siderophore-interacting protein [Pengzhenrongella sicca]